MDVDLARLLTRLGHLNPAIWDVIFPHGPVGLAGAGLRMKGGAEPNPQPSHSDRAQLAAVEVANQISQAAIWTEATGGKGAALVGDLIDEWCGTPWPRPWPWPPPGPPPGPEPPPFDVESCRVAAALAFASLAGRMPDGELRGALTDGSARLFEAGLSQ